MRPVPPVVLRAPGLVLHLDAAGTVTTVRSAVDRSEVWLAGCGELDVTTDGRRLALGVPRVGVDRDEVEVERVAGGLRTVVRHAVEQGWTVRMVLANESDTELVLDEVRLGWAAAPGTVVTALAAGARASYAVQPVAGEGPVLVGRLRSGVQAGVDESGLLLGGLVLPPHHRWAAQWRWQVVPDARRAGSDGLPPTTWLDRDRAVVLPAGPDVAVVAPGLAVEVDDDRVEVAAWEPGAHVVELRSARGTTTLPLTWAPDLDELVDAATTVLLAGATTPAGTPRLDGAAAALIVQDALARRATDAPDELVDALELVAGTLMEELDEATEPVDPLALGFLIREADRTGAAGLLDAAGRRFLGTNSAAPGLGLAGVGLALAQVRQGRPASEVVAHLGALLADAPPGSVAGLELAVLLSARCGRRRARPRRAPPPGRPARRGPAGTGGPPGRAGGDGVRLDGARPGRRTHRAPALRRLGRRRLRGGAPHRGRGAGPVRGGRRGECRPARPRLAGSRASLNPSARVGG